MVTLEERLKELINNQGISDNNKPEFSYDNKNSNDQRFFQYVLRTLFVIGMITLPLYCGYSCVESCNSKQTTQNYVYQKPVQENKVYHNQNKKKQGCYLNKANGSSTNDLMIICP